MKNAVNSSPLRYSCKLCGYQGFILCWLYDLIGNISDRVWQDHHDNKPTCEATGHDIIIDLGKYIIDRYGYIAGVTE
jgi:hypothetical protein